MNWNWMKVVMVLFIASSLTACSNNKKKEVSEPQVSSTEEADFVGLDEDADFIVDSEGEDLLAAEPSEDEMTEEPMVSEVQAEEPVIMEEQEMSEPAPVIATSGEMGSYQVEKGDTLMLIAFKIYGDYRKWKELVKHNPEVSANKLSEGVTLTYEVPEEKFVWNPDGLPYLIKNGDTLGSISFDVYGTQKKWKKIYDNNRPMIHDPNLIFAGFTLYYIPEREVASDSM